MKFGGSGITAPLYTWIREHVPPGAPILELGSGDVSTAVLANVYEMVSVEDNAQWLHRHPSTYIHAPLVDGWYSRAVLEALLPRDYALLLVDGPTSSAARVGFLRHLDLFRRDVPIVVDDTWRMCEHAMALTLGRILGRSVLHQQQFAVVLPS